MSLKFFRVKATSEKVNTPGADLGFSRGGILSTFFLGQPNCIFFSSPKALFCPYFGQIFWPNGFRKL